MNFRLYIDEAKHDPTLLSTINIPELLEEKVETVWRTIEETLPNNLSHEEKKQILHKLSEYKPIDEIHELQKGRHVRWIRKTQTNVTNGGILVDVKFLHTGTHILCMNHQKKFIQYKWDDCITYQKMTPEELCIQYLSKTIIS